MARVHLLNVHPGDCSIIEHNSGRITMIDICDGNLGAEVEPVRTVVTAESQLVEKGVRGNFGMAKYPSNPIDYLTGLGINDVFRFILTHPDMDHMDGLANLLDQKTVANFWDTGARRSMDLDNWGTQYKQEDWLAYERVVAGKQAGVKALTKLAGDRFAYANQGDGKDGLYIVAPNADLLCDPDEEDDINRASYIISYWSTAGKFIFPGDAHDESWDYAIRNHRADLENCAFLLAPHHGRDSDRSYEFLDVLKPKLTYIGNAPSQHIDYQQWSRRGLPIITSNQAGNVVLKIRENEYDVYVENHDFAKAFGVSRIVTNSSGYALLQTIQKGKKATA